MNVPSLRIRNASLAYAGQCIFRHLHLDIPAGTWIGILGASGVGKSSLLRIIAGLLKGGDDTQIVADNQLPVSQQIAYMAQTDLLLPWLSVLDNAMLGYKLRQQIHASTKERAKQLLAQVELAHATTLYPNQLSGGMRQRVALVRTLLEDKPIVLMDEPFSALDAITRYKLHELTAELLRDKTVIFITHDPLEALRIADDIYVMAPVPEGMKHALHLTTPKPRPLSDPQLLHYQQALYEQLGS